MFFFCVLVFIIRVCMCVFVLVFVQHFICLMYPLFVLMPMTIFRLEQKLWAFHVRAFGQTHKDTRKRNKRAHHRSIELFSSLTLYTISFIAYQCLMSTFYCPIIYFDFIIVYYQWTANKHQLVSMVWSLDLSVMNHFLFDYILRRRHLNRSQQHSTLPFRKRIENRREDDAFVLCVCSIHSFDSFSIRYLILNFLLLLLLSFSGVLRCMDGSS